MKKNLFVLLSLLVVASMALAACATAEQQESPAGFLGESTGPQTLGIQAEDGEIVMMFNADTDVKGGIMATLSSFGEVDPPAEVVIKIKVDGVEQKMIVTPGEQFFIPTENIDIYIDTIEIHADGWKFTRRGDENIWDGIKK